MSYLAQPTSKTDYGVVKVGDFINVSDDGIISSPEIVSGPGITVDYDIDFITVSATGADLISVIGVETNYTATDSDEYIGVNSANPVTISLPDSAVDGRVYIIKDEYGKGGGKITIQPPNGTLIDKRENYVIGVPNQSVHVVYRASSWWLI